MFRHTPLSTSHNRSPDLRVCNALIHVLNEWTPFFQSQGNIPSQLFSCRDKIKNLTHRFFDKKNLPMLQEVINSFIDCIRENGMSFTLDKKIRNVCDNILPDTEFEWFRHDESATFWLWGYILINNRIVYQDISIRNLEDDSRDYYDFFKLPDSADNHQQRVDIIIGFFDRLTPNFLHKGVTKSALLTRLKKEWKYICRTPRPAKWLPNDENAVLWAWESLTGHKDIYQRRLNEIFTPLTHQERLTGFWGILDLWDDNPDGKKLFLLNLNKAWNQRKLRQSRTDKKAVNTYLKNKTKVHLDELATHYNMRISDVLEKLINEKHQKLLTEKK